MPQAIKDIERPLGLHHKPVRDRAGRQFPWSSLPTAVIALVVVAASSAIALRDKPYRVPAIPLPDQTAIAKEVAPALAPAKKEAAVSSANPDGPSIIRVNPDTDPGNGVVIIRDPSAIGQNLRVAHLPDRSLIEETEIGPLPIRATDGRRPFDVYARPWSGARGARVAIVVGGMGLSQTGTQEALDKLPPEVTIGFASQGNSLSRWMQTARRAGHEVILQVPLEPFDYPAVDPGRNTLTVEADAAQNIEDLHRTLSRTTNYTGVMNYMGARFSADKGAMAPLMEELGKRGLMYLDDGTSARSVAPELALGNRVPFAAGDTVIDTVQDRAEILKKLDELERVARAKGTAIGSASAFGVTVDAVREWVGEARKRGIEIVPISALASDPERG